MKVMIEAEPKNDMEKDLGHKFAEDLVALVTRSVDTFVIGGVPLNNCSDILLSVLSCAMATIAKERGLSVATACQFIKYSMRNDA